jgi:Tfp pilus assembly protein PilO
MRIGLREAIFFLMLLGIPVAVWLFVFKPNNAQAEQMRAEIESKRHKLSLVTRASATIDGLKKEIQALEKAMTYFKEKLPNERQVPDVVGDISDLVAEHSLQQGQIQPASRALELLPSASPYSEMAFEIEVAGNFMDFYRFIQAVEALPRITRIQKIEIEGLGLKDIQKAEEELLEGVEPEEKVPGRIKATFVMSIFYAGKAQ